MLASIRAPELAFDAVERGQGDVGRDTDAAVLEHLDEPAAEDEVEEAAADADVKASTGGTDVDPVEDFGTVRIDPHGILGADRHDGADTGCYGDDVEVTEVVGAALGHGLPLWLGWERLLSDVDVAAAAGLAVDLAGEPWTVMSPPLDASALIEVLAKTSACGAARSFGVASAQSSPSASMSAPLETSNVPDVQVPAASTLAPLEASMRLCLRRHRSL